jgi:hypothetical protein
MLVEALDAMVQSHVRLGLLSPRAAAELSRLPRGNQEPAARLVIRDRLTVRQTERLVQALRECSTPEAGHELLARFVGGEHPFPTTPRRRQPSDADRLIRDSRATAKLCVSRSIPRETRRRNRERAHEHERLEERQIG